MNPEASTGPPSGFEPETCSSRVVRSRHAGARRRPPRCPPSRSGALRAVTESVGLLRIRRLSRPQPGPARGRHPRSVRRRERRPHAEPLLGTPRLEPFRLGEHADQPDEQAQKRSRLADRSTHRPGSRPHQRGLAGLARTAGRDARGRIRHEDRCTGGGRDVSPCCGLGRRPTGGACRRRSGAAPSTSAWSPIRTTGWFPPNELQLSRVGRQLATGHGPYDPLICPDGQPVISSHLARGRSW